MTDRNELLQKLNGVMGRLIASGLNELNQTQPDAGKQIAELMAQDLVFFRITTDFSPLTVDVKMHSRDGTCPPVALFSARASMPMAS